MSIPRHPPTGSLFLIGPRTDLSKRIYFSLEINQISHVHSKTILPFGGMGGIIQCALTKCVQINLIIFVKGIEFLSQTQIV